MLPADKAAPSRNHFARARVRGAKARFYPCPIPIPPRNRPPPIRTCTRTAASSRKTIDTIRTLAMDAVQKANSGHPGTPMAMAPVGYTLWSKFLRYDPAKADWANRDRFVLSVGHASMLLYSLIHLAGIEEIDAEGTKSGKEAVSIDDIEHFRQIGSKTPGHPEYRHTTGVETTTGPLGQGCGNSVGMAIAERWLAARYNKPDFTLFDYNVYTLAGDGDIMEGVSQEAASLAGHLRLSNLCWIYDSNHITIEGKTDLTFNEDVGQAVRGLWLERRPRERRQRLRGVRVGDRDVPRDRRPSRRSSSSIRSSVMAARSRVRRRHTATRWARM